MGVIVRRAKLSDLHKIYKRYTEDFPRCERKPFSRILANTYIFAKNDILVLCDEGKMVAYSMILKDSAYNAVLVDYLAVLPDERSKGYGSIFIDKFKEFYKDRLGIIIEIEEPGKADTDEENLLRDRRKVFYLKNGFEVQPVSLSLFGVEMNMLYLVISDKPDDFIAMSYDIYNRCVGKKLTERYIHVKHI